MMRLCKTPSGAAPGPDQPGQPSGARPRWWSTVVAAAKVGGAIFWGLPAAPLREPAPPASGVKAGDAAGGPSDQEGV